jgi:hypothetical protein
MPESGRAQRPYTTSEAGKHVLNEEDNVPTALNHTLARQNATKTSNPLQAQQIRRVLSDAVREALFQSLTACLRNTQEAIKQAAQKKWPNLW